MLPHLGVFQIGDCQSVASVEANNAQNPPGPALSISLRAFPMSGCFLLIHGCTRMSSIDALLFESIFSTPKRIAISYPTLNKLFRVFFKLACKFHLPIHGSRDHVAIESGTRAYFAISFSSASSNGNSPVMRENTMTP